MNLRTLAILILVPFAALTATAVVVDGSDGFPRAINYNMLTLQIWLDLVIAMVFWCTWVCFDERRWYVAALWVLGALAVGAFAPLLYLLIHQRWPASAAERPPAEGTILRRIVAALVLVVFGFYTWLAMQLDGSDIVGAATSSWSSIQIWVDLVIVIFLWLAWMFRDAQINGRWPWFWLVLALLIGCFSPLLYTVVYGRTPAGHPPRA